MSGDFHFGYFLVQFLRKRARIQFASKLKLTEMICGLSRQLDVLGENAPVGSRFILHVFPETVKELMAPEKMGGRLFCDQAHGVGENLFPLARIKRFPLQRQKLIHLWVRISNSE